MRSTFIVVAALLTTSRCLALAAGDPARAIGRVLDVPTHPYLARAGFADRQLDLQRLYDAVGWEPIWVRNGRPTVQAVETIAVLSDADARGLRAGDYDADRLRAEALRLSRTGPASADAVALFDSALTISLMRYAADAYAGRIAPASLGFVLDPEPKEIDLPALVQDVARTDDPATRLAALDPPVPTFAHLRNALAEMRHLAALTDLPQLPDDLATLRLNARHPAIASLRRRLAALGDLPSGQPDDETVYDGDVEDAVKRFERRHGREPDGVLGPLVLHDLRVPLATRIQQIELAMERMRWLSAEASGRSVIVNIPEFRLRAFERGDPAPRLSMKVVVGSVLRRTKTPVVHAHMRWVVFRPYWDVPTSIARKEILPLAARDPAFLAREGMEFADGRLRQRPGPRNALGLVKFVFPNPFDVYLHDTPQKAYFAWNRRDFSHGCIRVADAPALAEFALGWDRERISAAMAAGPDNRWVALPESVPVYVLYTTASVEGGRIFFFDDIYGYDFLLARALENRYRRPDGVERTGGVAGGDDGDARGRHVVPGERAVEATRRPDHAIGPVPGASPPVASPGSPRARPEGP